MLSARLKQTVLIDNKPGANSIIGTDAVAKSPPDGYTLLVALGAFTINPLVYKSLPYAPSQLAPVSLMGKVNLVLAVGAATPVRSFADLVKFAQQGQPVTYDSSGVGSALHLVGERISRATGLKAQHIPYKGIAQSLPDIVAGRLTFTINAMSSLGSFIRDGKLVPLAVLGRQRVPEIPDVPTIGELGYPALESYGWQGLMAPAATPAAIIDLLSRTVAESLKEPELRRKLVSMGLDPIGSTPAEFAAFIEKDAQQAAEVVKAQGIVAD